MKKFLILLFIPFLLSGCYDYNELSDLAVVTGIAVDYQDNEYEVTFEILSTKKEGENNSSTSTFTVSSKGTSLFEAFSRNGNLMDKVAYFDHIEVVIISDEVAKHHLSELAEYTIRTSKLRNEFYLILARDHSAKEIISTNDKQHPIASTFIVDMLENNKNGDSAGYYIPFTETLNSILTDGEDARISAITIEDDTLKLDGLAVFKDYEMQAIFDNDSASIINLLNNFNPNTVDFEHVCEKGKTIISIYDSDIKIEPKDDQVKVKGILNARIQEDSCGYSLRAGNDYTELSKIFKKVIEERMNKEIEALKQAQSNALFIGKMYYNKTRKKDYFKWTNQKFVYDIEVKMNKKGLTFEVQK